MRIGPATPITAALCLLALPAVAVTVDDFKPLTYTTHDGHVLRYRLYTPAGSGAKPMPLVVFLHGSGERGDDNLRQIAINGEGPFLFAGDAVQAKHPCYVLAPQCPERASWGHARGVSGPPSWPLQAVHALIMGMERDGKVDRTRVYATGLSMGGFGTWDLIRYWRGDFAAAIPVCGASAPVADAVFFAGFPVWTFHNADDPAVPIKESRGLIATMRAIGGAPGFWEEPTGGHASWTRAYATPGLADWLFSHTSRQRQPDLTAWAAATTASTARPAAPELRAFTHDGGTRLTWQPVPGALAYDVQRSPFPDGPFRTVASCIPATTDTDPTPSERATWYYTVTAVNEKGRSRRSNVVKVP